MRQEEEEEEEEEEEVTGSNFHESAMELQHSFPKNVWEERQKE